MSKGEIIAHVSDGLYRVRQMLSVERIQQEQEGISARIAALAVQLPEAKLARIQKEQHVKQVQGYINDWIVHYQADPDKHREGLMDNQKVLARLSGELRQLDLYVASLIAEDLSARKRQVLLEKVPDHKEIDAWCADYSLDLSGEVGLADINDEGGKGLLIRPGFDDDAVYVPARDGALFPDIAQNSAQAYFNAALLPGVQKWRPQYRVGTIAALKGDACNLSLDDAKSSAQGLSINKEDTLTGVQIHYMDCDGAVFEVGDRVIVEMQGRDWGEPRVIGFETNPRECGLVFLCFAIYGYYPTSNIGYPLHVRFYKINFRTYEISLHSEMDMAPYTHILENGYYVREREPNIGLADNPKREVPYADVADWGVLSNKHGVLSLGSPDRGVVSPAQIEGSEGVGISPDLYLSGGDPSRRQTTLVFFDIDTFSKTGEYSYQAGSPSFIFERVVANKGAIIVQTYDDWPHYYGLLSFDRNKNLIASHEYGALWYGAVSGIAANSTHVFVVLWGDSNRLFVHDASTLAIVYTLDIPDGSQKVAATNSHVILCSRKSEHHEDEDGRTEIYKIADDKSDFSLELKKTAYWHVTEKHSLFPIA